MGLGGNEFLLRETRGLAYIAHLLRHPDAEFHVLDLYGGITRQREEDETTQQPLPPAHEDLRKAGIHIVGLGDAAEMLDEQAKVGYRRRLSELPEELDEAKKFGKIERAEHRMRGADCVTQAQCVVPKHPGGGAAQSAPGAPAVVVTAGVVLDGPLMLKKGTNACRAPPSLRTAADRKGSNRTAYRNPDTSTATSASSCDHHCQRHERCYEPVCEMGSQDCTSRSQEPLASLSLTL